MPPKVMLPNQPKELWTDIHDVFINALNGIGPRSGAEKDAESADYKKWLEHKNSISDITDELAKLPQKVKNTQAYKDLENSLTVCQNALSGIPATVEEIDKPEKWPQFQEDFSKLFGYGEGEKSLSEQLAAFNEATGYKYLSNNAVKTTSYLCRRLEEARVKLEEATVKGANAALDRRAARIQNVKEFETQLKTSRDQYENACKEYDEENKGYKPGNDEPALDCRTDEGFKDRTEFVNGSLENIENLIPTLEKHVADDKAAIQQNEEDLKKIDFDIERQSENVKGIESGLKQRTELHADMLNRLYQKLGGQGAYNEETFATLLKEEINRQDSTISGLEGQNVTLAEIINELEVEIEAAGQRAIEAQHAADRQRMADERVEDARRAEEAASPRPKKTAKPPKDLMKHLKNQIFEVRTDISTLKGKVEIVQEDVDKYEAEKQRLDQGLPRDEVFEFGKNIFSAKTLEKATDCYLSIEALRGWVKAPTQEGTYSAEDIRKLATADGRKEVMNGQNEGLKTLADKLNKFVALYEEAYPKSYTTGNVNWIRGRTDSDVAARTMVEDYLKANPNGGDFGKEMNNPKNASISAFSKRLGATLVQAAGAHANDKINDLDRLVAGRKMGVEVKLNEFLKQRDDLNGQIAKLEEQKSKYEEDLKILEDVQKEAEKAKTEPKKAESEKVEPEKAELEKAAPPSEQQKALEELQKLKDELKNAKVEQARVLSDLKFAEEDKKSFLKDLTSVSNAKEDVDKAVTALEKAQDKLNGLVRKEDSLKNEKESKEIQVENNENSIKEYKALKEKLEKEQASLKKVDACKNDYSKKASNLSGAYSSYKEDTKGLFRSIDDTRLENSLAGMQKLCDRHDKNQGSHENSKEYDAVVRALAVASERNNYGKTGNVKGDIDKNLKELETAVDKYLEAKGTRRWGSSLRHTRMQFMDDIKAYCKTMRDSFGVEAKGLSKEQTKWENTVLREDPSAMCVAVAKGTEVSELNIEVGEINDAAYNVELSGNAPVEEEVEIQPTGI